MSRLVATLVFGREPPLGGGVEPIALAHCYDDAVARFLAYTVEAGDFTRVPGAYAPALDMNPAYPVTDLILALAPELSSIADRIQTLNTKAEANYGVGFREKAFTSDVARGSDGFGRHFEARSQLEAHPLDGAVAVSIYAPGEPVIEAIEANLDRLDAAVVRAT